MKHLLGILWFVAICLHPCIAQKPDLIFEHVSSAQGLSQSEVNCIIQDSKGFIWIGTLNGLNRFDGYDMVVYKSDPQNKISLVNNYIQSIFEDNQGNIWVGTVSGLNRYQRESDSFYRFENQLYRAGSNSKYSIESIIQRKNGDLLFGTNKGLFVLPFNHINDDEPKFERYLDFEINDIVEDKDGFLWLASWIGIYKIKFDDSNKPVITSHLTNNELNPSSLISNAVYSLFKDKEGNLWAGTDIGVDLLPSNMLSSSKPEFTHFPNSKSKSLGYVKCVIETSNGQTFIGTSGGGLHLINKNSKEIFSYRTDASSNISISNNSVKCLYEDKTGVLWVGTLGGGCNKVNLYQKQFVNYTIGSNNNKNEATSNFIRSIYQGKNNLLWIGTLDGGLYTFNEDENLFYNFPIFETKKWNTSNVSNKAILGNRVFTIIEENDEKLWVGANGLNIINKQTGTIKHHSVNFNNPDSLIGQVFSIAKDDDGSFWIGCWGALQHYQFNKNTGKSYFIRYQNNENDTNCISDNFVRYVYNDPLNSDLWVATGNGGINRLIQGSDKSVKFIQYKYNSNEPGCISNNSTYMILRSKAGVIWVATDNGLNKLIPGKSGYECTFQKYSEIDGLSGSQVKSILEDEKGNLWLGTNKGISKFNPSTKEFTNFDTFDGLLSSEYSDHSCFKNSEGRMFFGGVNGFTTFYPDRIQTNNIPPKVQFTNLFLFNKVVPVGKLPDGRTLLNKSISDTKEIELSYRDKVFAIEFSALHYSAPLKNRYAYKIEGVNDDWIYTDAKNRRATFTNLKAGTYILKVIGSNNDGVWQTTPTTLKIKVRPPFWLTGPAFFTYFLFVLFIVILIVRDIRQKDKLKADLALKNLEKEKVEELTQLKLQFFTNISHEFRTPLTLIISPLESIIDAIKENKTIREQLKSIHRNSRYLLNLVNELIDFRKAETDSLVLNACETNIAKFIAEIVSTFDEVAKQKSIALSLKTEIPEPILWIDREMMIKVFNNLIYNALKFTPENGKVIVEVGQSDDERPSKYLNFYKISKRETVLDRFVNIKISDSGVGISAQSLSTIFDRFYQVDQSDSNKHLGSGIGLALVKSLVLINKGEIIVSSERGVGTEFIVCLPMGDKHLNENQKIPGGKANDTSIAIDNSISAFEFGHNAPKSNENILEPQSDNKEDALLLIVEDNDELRNYLKRCFQTKYRIIEANNGLIGYNLAIEEIPDLVLSDVMMPEMNGVQLCKNLKLNTITSHIPIVLLTALASVINQIEGLETGADDYISKPFNQKLLEIRIENLLTSRRKLRERFGKEMETETKDFTLNIRDQEFLEKAIQLVKDKISDPELSVEQLSRDLLMSQRQLYRKITALTDQTPNEFIRGIRLKEAVLLLNINQYSISEIAYKVGFTAPNYFSTCFFKQFGLTPTDYLSRHNAK